MDLRSDGNSFTVAFEDGSKCGYGALAVGTADVQVCDTAQPRGIEVDGEDRMDWSLIERLAASKPAWHFVFVGPVADRSIIDRCGRLSNIHFPGPVGSESMPAVLSAFDVGLLPYRDTPFFHFLNPLKFYEMAAAGLPMVSSPIAELKRFPEALVTVTDSSPESWRGAIEGALSADRSQMKRIGREAEREFIWEDLAARVLKRVAALTVR